MAKYRIHNNKLDDSIDFNVNGEILTDAERQDILSQVHARCWEDADCWSERIESEENSK